LDAWSPVSQRCDINGSTIHGAPPTIQKPSPPFFQGRLRPRQAALIPRPRAPPEHFQLLRVLHRPTQAPEGQPHRASALVVHAGIWGLLKAGFEFTMLQYWHFQWEYGPFHCRCTVRYAKDLNLFLEGYLIIKRIPQESGLQARESWHRLPRFCIGG
jgi:hypothetical protein